MSGTPNRSLSRISRSCLLARTRHVDRSFFKCVDHRFLEYSRTQRDLLLHRSAKLASRRVSRCLGAFQRFIPRVGRCIRTQRTAALGGMDFWCRDNCRANSAVCYALFRVQADAAKQKHLKMNLPFRPVNLVGNKQHRFSATTEYLSGIALCAVSKPSVIVGDAWKGQGNE